MADLDTFRDEFVPNVQGFNKLSYSSWKSSNPGEAQKWETYRDALIAGQTPTAPALTTKFGKALVAAGKLMQQPAPPPPPPPPPPSSITEFSGDWHNATGPGYVDTTSGADYTFILDGTPGPRAQIVTSPTPRRGTYAVKFTCAAGQNRAEVADIHTTYKPGDEIWGAMSVYLDPTFPNVTSWFVFHQFFGETGGQSTGSPPFAFEINTSGAFVMMVRGGAKASAGTRAPRENGAYVADATLGMWHDFLFHARFAKDSTGLNEMWHRVSGGSFPSAPNASLTGINVLTVAGVDQNVYPETGSYRGTTTAQSVLFNNGLWIRGSRAAAEQYFA